MKTTAELQARLEHLRGVHPKEIGARVGETIELIEEILRLRQEVAGLLGITKLYRDQNR